MCKKQIEIDWLFDYINKNHQEKPSVWNELYNYNKKVGYCISDDKLSLTIVGTINNINEIFGFQLLDPITHSLYKGYPIQEWYDFDFVSINNLTETEVSNPIIFIDEELSFEMEEYIQNGDVVAVIVKDKIQYSEYISINKLYTFSEASKALNSILYGIKRESDLHDSVLEKINVPKKLTMNFYFKINQCLESAFPSQREKIYEVVHMEIANLINQIWLRNSIGAFNLIRKILLPTTKLINTLKIKSFNDLNVESIERELLAWLEKIANT